MEVYFGWSIQQNIWYIVLLNWLKVIEESNLRESAILQTSYSRMGHTSGFTGQHDVGSNTHKCGFWSPAGINFFYGFGWTSNLSSPKYWWYSNKGYTILYACLIWASKPMFIIFCLLFDIVSGWCYLYLLTWSRTLIFRTFCLPMILNMGCGRIVHLLSVIVPIHGTLAISACKLTWQSDFSRNVSFWSKEFLPVKLSLKSIDLWFMLTFLSSMLSKVFEMQFLRFI